MTNDFYYKNALGIILIIKTDMIFLKCIGYKVALH